MNRVLTIALIGFVIALAGCAQQSSRIEFVKQPEVMHDQKEASVKQYVKVYADDSRQSPVRRLRPEDFSVEVFGKQVKPTVYYTRNEDTKVAVSVLIDLSGSQDQTGKGMLELLKQIKRSESIHFAALTAANGTSIEPVKLSGFVRLGEFDPGSPAFSKNPPTRTLNGLSQAYQADRAGVTGKALFATVAIVRSGGADSNESLGVDSTGKPNRWPSGQPVIVVNYGADNSLLKQIAADSGGEYIQASGSPSAVFDKVNEAVKKSVGDQYAIRFPAPGADVVPPFKLSVSHDGVTDVAEIAPEKWTYQLVTILALALVALAISILVLRRRAGSQTVGPAPAQAQGYAMNTMAHQDATVGDMTSVGVIRPPGPVTAPPIHPGAIAMGDSTMGETLGHTGASGSMYLTGSDGDSTVGQSNPYLGSSAGDVTTGEDTMGNMFVPTHRSAQIRVVSGGAAGREISIRSDTEIGRSDGFTFQDGFLGLPGDGKVSRLHARFKMANGGRVEIQHLSHTNRTYVNGRTIDEREVLQIGDQIRLGDTVLEVAGIDHGDMTI